MIEGKPCTECKSPLYKRPCSYMPGGAVYVCPMCMHEYTAHAYNKMVKDSVEDNFEADDMILVEGASSGSGTKIILGDNNKEIVSESLKKLLEEKKDSNLSNLLASYDDPIEEV